MNVNKIKIIIFVLIFIQGITVHAGEKKLPAYLFSYFTGNGEDGLHLAYSHDGLSWKVLKEGESFLEPRLGDKLIRDPSIVQGSDGVFHMVWTIGWWEKGLGLAHSRDLINWSDQILLPVMDHEPDAVNCWAPEIFYDAKTKQFLIFWAATIPGRFPETEDPKDPKRNHRIYYIATNDFKSFTKASVFYNPGFSVIDSFITYDREKSQYVMLLKDETNIPVPEKNLRVAFAKEAMGPYGSASDPITGEYWAEGPSVLKIDGRWIVYFDKYAEHQYGAVASYDFKTWEDISDQIQFPPGTRHGTAFAVSSAVLEKLKTVKSEK